MRSATPAAKLDPKMELGLNRSFSRFVNTLVTNPI